MNWSAIAAVLLALAVILGAFGAHGLKARLDTLGTTPIWEKAAFYHLIHALGILIVSIIPSTPLLPRNATEPVCWLLLIGILVFSGSLYALAITGTRALGAITPIGGVCFIVGWLWLAFKLAQR
ncbi:MAG TPA: DUF423 domain-containing protein [Verrucomicrobiae bacterium]|nr:DUF423 domain-containing protein [Verrucomicrobiae bacterium]